MLSAVVAIRSSARSRRRRNGPRRPTCPGYEKLAIGNFSAWPPFGVGWLLSTGRDPCPNAGTLSRRALYLQSPAQAHGPLAHRLQTEVSREGPRRIEAHAIVAYPERDPVRAALKLQLHATCLGVLYGVVQCLLCDAVERLLCFQIHVGLLAVDGRSDRDFVPRA